MSRAQRGACNKCCHFDGAPEQSLGRCRILRSDVHRNYTGHCESYLRRASHEPKQPEGALSATEFETQANPRPRRAWRSVPRKSTSTPFWPLLPWQQGFVDTLPAYMDCAADFEHGTFRRQRDLALGFPHIQVNSHGCKRWMPFDIDRKDAEKAHERSGIAAPNLIMLNPASGHGHLLYELAAPVTYYERSRLASIRYCADVQRGMTRRLDADKAFAGHLIKNPLSERWETLRLHDKAYSLGALANCLDKGDMRCWDTGERESGLGRNVTLFEALCGIAYRKVCHFKQDGASLAAFNAWLQSAAFELNAASGFTVPLAPGEVRSIARSVSAWTWKHFTPDRLSEIQRARANRRWTGHTSLEKSQPWKAEGIGRSTWFRRQKADGRSEGETLPYQDNRGIGGLEGFNGATLCNRAAPPFSREGARQPA